MPNAHPPAQPSFHQGHLVGGILMPLYSWMNPANRWKSRWLSRSKPLLASATALPLPSPQLPSVSSISFVHQDLPSGTARTCRPAHRCPPRLSCTQESPLAVGQPFSVMNEFRVVRVAVRAREIEREAVTWLRCSRLAGAGVMPVAGHASRRLMPRRGSLLDRAIRLRARFVCAPCVRTPCIGTARTGALRTG